LKRDRFSIYVGYNRNLDNIYTLCVKVLKRKSTFIDTYCLE